MSLKRESCIPWHLIYLYGIGNLDLQMFLGNTNVLREVEAMRAFLSVKFLYMSANMCGSVCVAERLLTLVMFGLMLALQCSERSRNVEFGTKRSKNPGLAAIRCKILGNNNTFRVARKMKWTFI